MSGERFWAEHETFTLQQVAEELGVSLGASESEVCPCDGKPLAYGFDGDPTHERGMCEHCDAVRCDAYPGACRPGYREPWA